MSVKTEYKIDCGVCLETIELFSPTRKEATDEARRMGWIVRKMNICPGCQKIQEV